MKTPDLFTADIERIVTNLIGTSPGWRPVQARPVVLDGGETVRVVWRCGRAKLLVVESPLGAPFPGYAQRLRLRDSLGSVRTRAGSPDPDAHADADTDKYLPCAVVSPDPCSPAPDPSDSDSPAPDSPAPDSPDRGALRDDSSGDDSPGDDRDILLFTDASHTRFVCSGVATARSGATIVEEFPLGDDPALLAPLFGRRLPARQRSSERRAGEMRVFSTLRSSARLHPAPRSGKSPSPPEPDDSRLDEGPPHRDLIRSIREIDDPDRLRQFVATLHRVIVLDDRPESGDWLLGAADALELLRRAALARMRSFLLDAPPPGAARPEYLRDFRRAVDAVDESVRRVSGHNEGITATLLLEQGLHVRQQVHPTLFPDAEFTDAGGTTSPTFVAPGPSPAVAVAASAPIPCAVRRMIAQRQLFAIGRDAGKAASLRQSLGEWVGFPPETALAIDLNVTAVAQNSLCSRLTPPADDILIAAWNLIAADRLTRHDIEPDAWRTASRALERRRAQSPGASLVDLFPILAGQARPIMIRPTGPAT